MRQKRTYLPAALMAGVLLLGAGVANARGGISGGGGGGGGGGTTSGGTTSGGGTKTVTTCTGSMLAVTATNPMPGRIDVSWTISNCAPKSNESLRVTDSSGAVVFNDPDTSLTTYSIATPKFQENYTIEVKLIDKLTFAVLETKSVVVNSGDPGPNCATALAEPAATMTSGYVNVTAGYTSIDCGYGRQTVNVRLTNTATGVVELDRRGLAGGIGTLALPANQNYDTVYTETVEVYGALGELLATDTKPVTTPAKPAANCATITGENNSVGYWGVYAAVWIQYQVKDCGYGGQRVRVWVRDMVHDTVDFDVTTTTLSGLFDFEGTSTKYDTDYEVHVDVYGIFDELLDSSTSQMHTPVMK